MFSRYSVFLMVEMEMVALALSVFVCDESVVCVYANFKKKVPKI